MEHYSTAIGIDLGDKMSALCVLDAQGDVVEEAKIRTTRETFDRHFKELAPCRIAMETGTHSRWVSALLSELGHEVIVADARRLHMIFANENKSDRVDAQTLARVVRFDPKLLTAVHHRRHETQLDLAQLKARDLLVRQRTQMINHVRQTAKGFGCRLPVCDADYFWKRAPDLLPESLKTVLNPLLEVLALVQGQIRAYDQQVKALCEEHYPETELLRQVPGVGPVTALAYVLTLDDCHRFGCSRQVGSFFGLRPRSDQSGETNRQLPITKCGNQLGRRLLVTAAHYILGPFGPDCDLRRFGMHLAERGGSNAKKRAVVAVARKLSVLLHRLWATGEVYDPLYNTRGQAA